MAEEEEICVDLKGAKLKDPNPDGSPALGDNTKDIIKKLQEKLAANTKISAENKKKVSFGYREVTKEKGKGGARGGGAASSQTDYEGQIVLDGVDYYNYGTDYGKIGFRYEAPGGLKPKVPDDPKGKKQPKTGPFEPGDPFGPVKTISVSEPLGCFRVCFDVDNQAEALVATPILVPFRYVFDSEQGQLSEMYQRLVLAGVDCTIWDGFIVPVCDNRSGAKVRSVELVFASDPYGVMPAFPWMMHFMPGLTAEYLRSEGIRFAVNRPIPSVAQQMPQQYDSVIRPFERTSPLSQAGVDRIRVVEERWRFGDSPATFAGLSSVLNERAPAAFLQLTSQAPSIPSVPMDRQAQPSSSGGSADSGRQLPMLPSRPGGAIDPGLRKPSGDQPVRVERSVRVLHLVRVLSACVAFAFFVKLGDSWTEEAEASPNADAIAGVVLGPDDVPVTNVEVGVVPVSQGERSVAGAFLGGGKSVRVEAGGKFLLSGVEAGEYFIAAIGPEFASFQPLRVRSPAQDVQVRGEWRHLVRVRLLQPDGANYTGKIRSWTRNTRDESSGQSESARDGVLELTTDGSSRQSFDLLFEEFAPVSIDVPMKRERGPIDLGKRSLEIGVSLTGTVVDGAGRPVTGAQVCYEHVRCAETDSAGEFVLRHLPARRGEVTIEAEEFLDFRGDIDSSTKGHQRLTLRRGCFVRGVVVNAKGAPESVGLVLRRVAIDDKDPISVSSEDDGTFQLRIQAGNYEVLHGAVGRERRLKEFTARDGETLDLKVVLP